MTGESLEVLAGRAGVEARTLRAWTRRYLGATLYEYRGRVGWEWILECALRTAGYVDAPPVAAGSAGARRLPVTLRFPRIHIRTKRRVPF
jgi:hypothetical protein